MPGSTRARAGAGLLAVLVALVPAVDGSAHPSTEDAPSTNSQATSGSSGSSGTASRQREIEARIRELSDAVGEASAEEAALIRELRDTQRELDGIDSTVASIDGELRAANARLGMAQEEVNRLDGRYLAMTVRLRDSQRAIDVVTDEVANVAAELYRRSGGGAQAAALTNLALDAETPQDLFAGARYLRDSAANSREKLEELQALKERVSSLREGLDDEREAAKAARDTVARERATIADLLVRQEAARDGVAGTVARQEQLLDQIQAKKSQFNAEIAALRAESESIAALLRNRQSGQALVPSGSGVLGIPVNAPITSGFGQRRHPILGTTRMHTGIDMGAGHGVTVSSAGDGEVVWAGPRGGYGNTVIIDHGNALATLYAHLSSVAVGVGQSVSRGQAIGAVGSTGLSTGPHLHFEVRVRGTPVDPLQYL